MDNFFKGLNDLVSLLSKLAESASSGEEGKEWQHRSEHRVKGPGGKSEVVYGINIRSQIGSIPPSVRGRTGVPRSQSSSTSPGKVVSTGRQGEQVGEEREPLIDIFDEGQEIVIIAEMPGVHEREISIDIQDDILCLNINRERPYSKEILLPTAVDAASMKQVYRNDILEVRLKKK